MSEEPLSDDFSALPNHPTDGATDKRVRVPLFGRFLGHKEPTLRRVRLAAEQSGEISSSVEYSHHFNSLTYRSKNDHPAFMSEDSVFDTKFGTVCTGDIPRSEVRSVFVGLIFDFASSLRSRGGTLILTADVQDNRPKVLSCFSTPERCCHP